jgi:hypothetical protein
LTPVLRKSIDQLLSETLAAAVTRAQEASLVMIASFQVMAMFSNRTHGSG